MNDWLIGFSQDDPTDGELLYEALERFSVPELQKLAFDVDPLSQPTHVDELRSKILDVERQGRELAHENMVLEKIAFLPALAAGAARLAPLAGKAVGSLGGAKGIIGGVARDMAITGAASKVMGALKPAAPAAAAAGEVAGGFKYAFAGNLLQQAAGYVTKNPGTALTAAGAVGGALMAPRDQQTGQKQYLKGALIGGVGTAGANAISNGALANRTRAAVMNRESPLFGQGARRYLMNSAAATQGKSPVGTSLRSNQVQYAKGPAVPDMSAHATPTPPPTPVERATHISQGQSTPREWASFRGGVAKNVGTGPVGSPVMAPGTGSASYYGGPSMGAVKLGYIGRVLGHHSALKEKKANQQTLTYDPATKTFTRQHLNSSQGSEAVKALGAAPIPAGHREPVRNTLARAAGPARRVF